MDFYGGNVLQLLNIEVFSGNEPAPWIRRFFGADRGSRPSILYLLLLGPHFGSVEEFEKYAASETSPQVPKASRKPPSDNVFQKHRDVLLNLIESCKVTCRGDLFKQAPGTYDFFMRFDKEFFQSHVAKAIGTSLKARERVDWATIDTSMAVKLEAIFSFEYSKETKPLFLTRTGALKACEIFQKYRCGPSRFPKVEMVITKHLESRESFYRRRLNWAIIEMTKTRTPISANKLRRVADLREEILHSNRDFIISTANDKGGKIDARTFRTWR